MIHVENLTRHYQQHVALDGVSFDVEKGEILGFLGPNGAGKTTAMRILTCFLSPTSGSASVAGHDVFSEPDAVRREIGYLPESVPLYTDMRVNEYLDYRARLKRVPRSVRRARLDRAIERCDLGEVRRRIIGTLSKGFRQRVGLADTLVHDPRILILDDPTAGLDPNQIREVRELIRELGREHTILLSTHILPEVEMLCGRVVIIARGRVVAMDTPDKLRQAAEGKRQVSVELRGAAQAELVSRLEGIAGVLAVVPGEGEGRFTLEVDADRDVREDVFRAAVAGGLVLTELSARAASLEDVFVQITTRETA
jgi:ABC-2 type transport system ATP-binding protein